MSRRAEIQRQTRETEVSVTLEIDGQGDGLLASGVPVLDHLLDQIRRHGLFDLEVQANGDLQIDPHHTTEDIGITLGQAFDAALGERQGVRRFAHAYAPLDEALSFACVDLSGRGSLVCDADCFDAPAMMGDFPLELVHDFFAAFASAARSTIHLRSCYGRNLHHRVESLFKAFALALRAACERDPRRGDQIPSTKGVL